MNRLEESRKIVDQILLDMVDVVDRRCAYVHLYGVSQLSSVLAMKRGLDAELAAICGMFHDIYAYRTGIILFHDQNSAEEIRPIIRDMGLFTAGEQLNIVSAVFHHGDKESVHQPFDELLKDADILQHYLYNTSVPVNHKRVQRLQTTLEELALPCDFEVAECAGSDRPSANRENRRAMLADVAESLASKDIVGLPDNQCFRAICQYWPGDDVLGEYKDNWCAAFVYHCCMQAGLILPVRHPLVSCRFGAVKAWLEWAKLPETGFLRSLDDIGFAPSRGDLVIYDQLLSDHPHDHIGVVLSHEDDSITVAEGNADKNRSSVVRRSCNEGIVRFIRIDDHWQYDDTGRVYDPQVLGRK